MRERELLQRIAERSADLGAAFPGVLVGPGDDCAVLAGDPRPLLLTVDHLVQGRHFDDALPLDLVGRKAVARSVSDIAAMAGRPAWALATALLPAGWPHADELFGHMADAARAFGCPLVGGDVASHAGDGPLTLTVTAGGHPVGERPVLRSGANAGDSVYATGRFGGSPVAHRHARFDPRVEEAAALAGLATAMIDASDGLGVDAGRIAEASGATIELDAATIPVHPDARDLDAALGDGEDYELVFTAPDAATVPEAIFGTPITRIGLVVERGEHACVVVLPGGARRNASDLGFEHG
ncbi:MAG: thiamine-phosphate kinase [Planctomycetota bacterium]